MLDFLARMGLVTSICVRALYRKSYLTAVTQRKSAGHKETWPIMIVQHAANHEVLSVGLFSKKEEGTVSFSRTNVECIDQDYLESGPQRHVTVTKLC